MDPKVVGTTVQNVAIVACCTQLCAVISLSYTLTHVNAAVYKQEMVL